jgi:glycosyltransferase involved in cell wall biosynthesis
MQVNYKFQILNYVDENIFFEDYPRLSYFYKKTKKMNIGYEAKRAFCNNTGLGNYNRFIIDNILKLKQKNFKIFAFTPKIKKGNFDSFPNDHIVLPKASILSAIWRIYFIKNQIKSKSIDLFHGLSNEIPLFLNWGKTKTVVTIHDLIFLKYPQYYSFVDIMIYKFKYKYACQKSHKIIAISRQTKNDIIEHFNIPETKIEVIYQSIQDVFRLAVSGEKKEEILQKYELKKPFFLTVGTLEPRKNQLNIVKAFHHLNDKNLELVLVGRGKKYKEELIAYIETNKLENVKVLSNVLTEELPALYQSCMSFIYISTYEGFGIPIVEALASKKAIIAAKGSCLEEAAGGGAVYIDPENIEEISDAMHNLSHDQMLRENLIKNGQEHLKNFDSHVLINQVLGVYESLI